MCIYFGGSRHFTPNEQSISVIRAVVLSGAQIHVGCQFGADQAVVSYVGFFAPSQLRAFAVAPNHKTAPLHIQQAPQAQVTYAAGGTSAPIPARYLLRSLAALAGCSAAVFFLPGSGSLSVARHAHAQGIPVFVFAPQPPAPLASGVWVSASFHGFSCWQFQPTATQPTLF